MASEGESDIPIFSITFLLTNKKEPITRGREGEVDSGKITMTSFLDNPHMIHMHTRVFEPVFPVFIAQQSTSPSRVHNYIIQKDAYRHIYLCTQLVVY